MSEDSRRESRSLCIRVLDDSKELTDGCVEKIRSALSEARIEGDVEGIDWSTREARSAALTVLEARRTSFIRAQEKKGDYEEREGESIFDGIDVLFVDYKLFSEENSQVDERRLTGLELSYLVRAYTSCKVIVALNSQGGYFRAHKHFDLTLKDAADRIENLHITTSDIDSVGLWSISEAKDYRPWAWSLLGDEARVYESRLNLGGEALRAAIPLVDFLGFDDDAKAMLPAFAIDHLGRKGMSATASDFLWYSGKVVRGDDFNVPHSFNRESEDDYRRKIEGATLLMPGVRLLAMAVHRWLDRMVLAAQDILVDRPHLLMRWPGLAPTVCDDVNEMTKWGLNGFGKPLSPLDGDESLGRYQFTPSIWLTRPAYWWPRIQGDRGLNVAVREANRRIKKTSVFLEDESSFAPSESAKSFKCGLPSVYSSTRYCAGPDLHQDVNYEPQSRLAQ